MIAIEVESRKNLTSTKKPANRMLVCWVLLVLLFTGCATTQYQTLSLPAAMQDRFDSCSTAEGSFLVKLRDENRYVGSFDMDWLYKRSLVAEVYTAHGQTLLKMKIFPQTRQVNMHGRLATRLPKIAVTEETYFEIDGHTIPLRVHELACLWGYKIPATWKNHVTGQLEKDGVWYVAVEDSDRTINIELGDVSRKPRKQCIKLSWTRFLGMVRKSFVVCQNIDVPRQLKISGIDNWTMTMMEPEE